MSSYNELIKNFEKVRSYIHDFYIYGFKTREQYDKKSLRSYDDERRRIESWLGEYVKSNRSDEGKNIFISIDSRDVTCNPLYKIWKAKSFTDRDITLHFIIFDILCKADISHTIVEIMEIIDKEYLYNFCEPIFFDESTVRKKLNEYCDEGLIIKEKLNKKVTYRRSEDICINDLYDALIYFSEVLPCGVIGSFLLDRINYSKEIFSFKHHFITSSIDSEVLLNIFLAIREKRVINFFNNSRNNSDKKRIHVLPLEVFISVQDGKQCLLGYNIGFGTIKSFRIDNISDVQFEDADLRFDEFKNELNEMKKSMWGVSVSPLKNKKETVEFTIKVKQGEKYIVRRLMREKRIGVVKEIDNCTYQFFASVYNSGELIPWIRTFICRIVDIHFSNPIIDKRFKNDLKKMYEMYEIKN